MTRIANAATAEEYIDTAIAKNIEHSLKMYQYGGHFRQLLDLYERGELTNFECRGVLKVAVNFISNGILFLNLLGENDIMCAVHKSERT